MNKEELIHEISTRLYERKDDPYYDAWPFLGFKLLEGRPETIEDQIPPENLSRIGDSIIIKSYESSDLAVLHIIINEDDYFSPSAKRNPR